VKTFFPSDAQVFFSSSTSLDHSQAVRDSSLSAPLYSFFSSLQFHSPFWGKFSIPPPWGRVVMTTRMTFSKVDGFFISGSNRLLCSRCHLGTTCVSVCLCHFFSGRAVLSVPVHRKSTPFGLTCTGLNSTSSSLTRRPPVPGQALQLFAITFLPYGPFFSSTNFFCPCLSSWDRVISFRRVLVLKVLPRFPSCTVPLSVRTTFGPLTSFRSFFSCPPSPTAGHRCPPIAPMFFCSPRCTSSTFLFCAQGWFNQTFYESPLSRLFFPCSGPFPPVSLTWRIFFLSLPLKLLPLPPRDSLRFPTFPLPRGKDLSCCKCFIVSPLAIFLSRCYLRVVVTPFPSRRFCFVNLVPPIPSRSFLLCTFFPWCSTYPVFKIAVVFGPPPPPLATCPLSEATPPFPYIRTILVVSSKSVCVSGINRSFKFLSFPLPRCNRFFFLLRFLLFLPFPVPGGPSPQRSAS